MQKDYTSISPSAKSLLLSKGITNIPFAKEAAEQILKPDTYIPDLENSNFMFWMRVLHFEDRYFSIDELLKDIPTKNMLELSSGFSFRGLDITSRREKVHFIDSDLPGIIDVKRELLEELPQHIAPGSKLELLPLNAVDGEAFYKTAERFDQGPLTIVNEGLLMYLNDEEKKKLCKTIHTILKERGGHWITADIYIKTGFDTAAMLPEDDLSKLIAAHKIDEKKFENFEQAAEFFNELGFVIDKKLEPNYTNHSSFPYLLKTLPPEVRESGKPPPKFRETWRLKVAE